MARIGATLALAVFSIFGCARPPAGVPYVSPDVSQLSVTMADSLGAAAHAAEQYRRALVFDRHAAELEPSRIGPVQRVGVGLFETGNLPEALDWLMRARGLDTLAVPPLYWTGIVHSTLGHHAIADSVLQRVAALRPTTPAPYVVRTYAALAQGNLAEADAWSARAIATAPSATVALMTRGEALLFAGRTQEARHFLDSARAIAPAARNGYAGRALTTLLAFALASTEHRDSVEVLLRTSEQADLLRRSEGRDSQQYAYDLAAVAALRRDGSKACEWLRQAADDGWTKPALARQDPLFASVRTQPCFERILSDVDRRLTEAVRRLPR